MGLFDKLKGNPANEQINELKACANGNVITLADVNDGVFSTGMLGNGIAIEPDSDTILAPCSGEVSAMMHHAVGLTTKSGMELIIHIGLDTVEMNGDGFTAYVKQGDKVKTGQKLIAFDRDKIAAAGHRDVIMMVITNSDDCPIKETKTGMHAVAGETTVIEI